jgi:hypothetical protein
MYVGYGGIRKRKKGLKQRERKTKLKIKRLININDFYLHPQQCEYICQQQEDESYIADIPECFHKLIQ